MTRHLLPLALLTLTLTLSACNRNNPTNTDLEPLTLTLIACSANVPVTESNDGATDCTPIILTLPNN